MKKLIVFLMIAMIAMTAGGCVAVTQTKITHWPAVENQIVWLQRSNDFRQQDGDDVVINVLGRVLNTVGAIPKIATGYYDEEYKPDGYVLMFSIKYYMKDYYGGYGYYGQPSRYVYVVLKLLHGNILLGSAVGQEYYMRSGYGAIDPRAVERATWSAVERLCGSCIENISSNGDIGSRYMALRETLQEWGPDPATGGNRVGIR